MSVFTLRLNPSLAKSFDRLCAEKGFSKNGLINNLVRDFLKQQAPTKKAKAKSSIKKLVGIVSLGGDAISDADSYFE